MEHLHLTDLPDLENAIFVGAFAGWNDAANAATWAIKFLINQWDAVQFGEIDPQHFYDFTVERPQVRITGGNVRRMTWPANRLYYHRTSRPPASAAERDVVLFLGQEPHLHWKTFCGEIVDVCKQCHVTDMVLFGALAGEVSHSMPVQIAGTSSNAATVRRMERLHVTRANYEGSTGILSVLQEAWRKEGQPVSSLWGTAPHYVSATPNLPVSEALLERLDSVFGFGLRLDDLRRAARRFTARVSSLVASDPEVSAYVHQLEQREPGSPDVEHEIEIIGDASGVHQIPVEGDLPSAEQAIQDIEEWLRQFRGDAGLDT